MTKYYYVPDCNTYFPYYPSEYQRIRDLEREVDELRERVKELEKVIHLPYQYTPYVPPTWMNPWDTTITISHTPRVMKRKVNTDW